MKQLKSSRGESPVATANHANDNISTSSDGALESEAVLSAGSLISESRRILGLNFRDSFYAVYSAEVTASGARIGITEYFPAELAARAPDGGIFPRSLEFQDLFDFGRERFIAEARALSGLRHPNLLPFDGVVSDHGTAFALHAPEEGKSLREFVNASPEVPAQEEIDAHVRQLVSALDLLHSGNLIHANITPDTVLLRPEPLVIRFGATRCLLAARMRKVNLAVTPGYSAPELHFSDAKAHGPLCDVFSLAAALYFVVTGRHPTNVIARGLGHTMPPAAATASQKFRAEFLEAIDRGLELEPQRRPPTMKAFGEMLFGVAQKKAYASHQPASALAAKREEGPQVNAKPALASPKEMPPLAANTASESPASTASRDTEDDDDNFDDSHDLGGVWSGLGLGRVLIALAMLAFFIPAALWMLEADAPVPQSAPVTGAVALQPPEPKQPDAALPKAAPPPETTGEKTLPKIAKAEPLTPPMPKATLSTDAGFTFKDCEFCPSLVVVPKGEFTMGSKEHPHEKPAHKVKISAPFAMGQYEVTMEEWDRCVNAGACRFRPERRSSPKQPAGNLSWEDANAYVKWLSEKTGQIYRLPSESEWEYASRGGTGKRFWWGEEAGSGRANCIDCGSVTGGQAGEVGAFKPNPFGLYDTAGNMAEWVQDCWNESYQGAPTDGSAWLKGNCSSRGLRGGSFGSRSADVRSSARWHYDADVPYPANGFRVVRELR